MIINDNYIQKEKLIGSQQAITLYVESMLNFTKK